MKYEGVWSEREREREREVEKVASIARDIKRKGRVPELKRASSKKKSGVLETDVVQCGLELG
jgi:hypothetical protein